MRISTFFYTLGQGLKNIFRNAMFSLASIATIGACLLLFGIFYSVVVNFQHIIKTAEEGVSVTVFFDEGISDQRITEIGDLISKRTEVSKINFVSADEAWETFKAESLGEYGEGFTENPLEDCANYEIYLNDVSQQQSLVTYLESVEGIRDVNRSEITANMLSGVNNLVGYMCIAIIGILLAVSVFLIGNTVMMGIAIRKEEIGIMKYIGATDFFVRAPFVVEGLVIGLIGSIIPLVLNFFIYKYAMTFIVEKFTILQGLLVFLPVETVFATLIPVSLGIGAGIGFLGSFHTVRKHLRV